MELFGWRCKEENNANYKTKQHNRKAQKDLWCKGT